MNPSLYKQMVVHHILPILAWPLACTSDRVVVLVAYCMVTEVTNIFLNSRWFLGELNIQGPLKLMVDVGFLLSFTVVRILTIPIVIYYSYMTDWSSYIAKSDALIIFLTIFAVIPFV